MATIRKRGNTYQIRVSCGVDITGRQIIKTKTYKPIKGMTAKQIEKDLQKQAALFEEDCQNGLILDNNITFAEFVNLWRKQYAEKNLKAKTLLGYEALFDNILLAIGHIKLAQLKPIHLIQFYNNLSEKGIRKDTKYIPTKNIHEVFKLWSVANLSEHSGISTTTLRDIRSGKRVSQTTAAKLMESLKDKTLFIPDATITGLSGKTILKYHRVISAIFTTAVQWQFIIANPCQRIKPPKAETKEAQYLDDKEVLFMISKLRSEPLKYHTAIMLLINTGCRRGELLGLEWSDIDFDKCSIKINKELIYIPHKGLVNDTPKNETSNRIIKISHGMIKLLLEWRSEQAKQKLIMGDKWDNSNKIFTNDFGKPLNPDSFSKWFKCFIARHNLPDAHIHTLRHTSASLLIADGTDIRTVSKRLGHANTSTTLDIYSHAIQAADELAAERLDRLFKQA